MKYCVDMLIISKFTLLIILLIKISQLMDVFFVLSR